MPTQTYLPLATLTLSSDTQTINFSNIPTTFNGSNLKDLVLVTQARSAFNAATATMYCYPNNSSSAVNSWVVAYGNGSTATYDIQAPTDFLWLAEIPGNTATAGVFGVSTVQFMDYAENKHKPVLMRSNISTSFVHMVAGRWGSTSVLTNFRLYNTAAADFKAGSTFSLYGIVG
jgi:hypothetical protein